MNSTRQFHEKYSAFLAEFGHGRKMVLSTSENGRVSSRMMSVVRIADEFFFQTDTEFRKYRQLRANKNVALCIDNIQIEGLSDEVGHPLENSGFCEVFKNCFKGSYDAYTALRNERLFAVKPLFVERWIYDGGIPYIETFDIVNEHYSCEKYMGE